MRCRSGKYTPKDASSHPSIRQPRLSHYVDGGVLVYLECGFLVSEGRTKIFRIAANDRGLNRVPSACELTISVI